MTISCKGEATSEKVARPPLQTAEAQTQLSVQFSAFVILISVTFRRLIFVYYLAVGWNLCVGDEREGRKRL